MFCSAERAFERYFTISPDLHQSEGRSLIDEGVQGMHEGTPAGTHADLEVLQAPSEPGLIYRWEPVDGRTRAAL